MKIAIFLSVLMLSGCGLLRPQTEDPTKLIYYAAREGTFLAINEIHKDNLEERVLAAAKVRGAMSNYVLPLLFDPDSEITLLLEENIFSKISEEYHGIMAAAYETLHSYYEFPTTSDVLPESYLPYLRAFFNGIRDGADRILMDEGITATTSLSIPEEN